MPIKLKNKTNLIVKETGKPVFKLEGENVSEKSATIKVDDFWVNLPSIHGNMRYSEDELYEKILFAIKNQEILQQSKLNSIPKQFDWKVIASEYDQRLKNIV